METRDYFRELFKEGGTDPTYKEWKLQEFINKVKDKYSTDPTYKEWKPLSLPDPVSVC